VVAALSSLPLCDQPGNCRGIQKIAPGFALRVKLRARPRTTPVVTLLVALGTRRQLTRRLGRKTALPLDCGLNCPVPEGSALQSRLKAGVEVASPLPSRIKTGTGSRTVPGTVPGGIRAVSGLTARR